MGSSPVLPSAPFPFDAYKVGTAYEKFRELNKLPYNSNSNRLFLKFLEIENITYPLPEAAIRKLKWLNGPNAKTIYKIWKIQHEAENNDG